MSVDSLKFYLANGKIAESQIDSKVLNILRTIIGFGLKDKKQLNTQISLDNPKSANVALNVAREGIVLLRNVGNILPIKQTKIKKIVVCGPNASSFISGGGSGRLDPFHFVSTLEGIQKIALENDIKVSYVSLDSVAKDESKIREKFRDANLVVACFGFNSKTEKEGCDRTFKLPDIDTKLIEFAISTGKPIIGVVNAGGAVEMQQWYSKLSGLLWAWYPGQEGGTAIAEVLFGKTNPSGKLPITFEKKWEDNPTFNSYYDTDNDKRVSYSEGIFVGYRGYDKFKKPVQFPFGFGLSYTKFQLSDIIIEAQKNSDSRIFIKCNIRNIGTSKGAQVVQLYINNPNCVVPMPVKELKGYEKVQLSPGETKLLTFEISRQDLSFYSEKAHQFIFEKGNYNFMLGTSSRDILLQKKNYIE